MIEKAHLHDERINRLSADFGIKNLCNAFGKHMKRCCGIHCMKYEAGTLGEHFFLENF